MRRVLSRQAQLGRQHALDVGPLGVGLGRQETGFVAKGERSRVGDARAHGQQRLAQLGRIVRDIARQFGARAHQAHGPLQHVDELGQLVEPVPAQDRADAGDARVMRQRERQAAPRRAIDHGAQFVDAKRPAAAAHALLAKEHRPRRVELDRQRHQREQGREQDEATGRQHQIEAALAAGRQGERRCGAHGTPAAMSAPFAASAVRTAAATRSTSAWLMRG